MVVDTKRFLCDFFSAEKGKAEARATQLEEELALMHKDFVVKSKNLESQRKEVKRLYKEEERLEQADAAGAYHLRSLAGVLVGRVHVVLSI